MKKLFFTLLFILLLASPARAVGGDTVLMSGISAVSHFSGGNDLR